MKTLKPQNGLSLLELMVSLFVGLILLAGIIQVLISNRQASRLQEALAGIQDNGRVASEYLSRAIRKADYWGCAPDVSNYTNHLNPGGTGYVDYTSFTGLAGTEGDGVNGSDSITVAGLGSGNVIGSGAAIALTSQMPNTSANIQLTSNASINVGDIVFLGNCSGGDVFQVTGKPSTDKITKNTGGSVSPGNMGGNCVNTGNGACNNCLCQAYGTDAKLFTGIVQNTFFIGTAANGEPALMLTDSTGTYELAQGIEQMQITYGEDTNDDKSADRYLPANSGILDMDNVVSVKVNFLVRSSEPVNQSNQSHQFNWEERLANNSSVDTEITASDLRLRRVYSMTVSVRNRVD